MDFLLDVANIKESLPYCVTFYIIVERMILTKYSLISHPISRLVL